MNTFAFIIQPTVTNLERKYMSILQILSAGVTCDCSQVHVTVCVGSRGYCALNENGCRDDEGGTEVAFSPFAQKSGREGTNGIDCRLCQKRNTMAPSPAPAAFLKPSIQLEAP